MTLVRQRMQPTSLTTTCKASIQHSVIINKMCLYFSEIDDRLRFQRETRMNKRSCLFVSFFIWCGREGEERQDLLLRSEQNSPWPRPIRI